MKMLAAMTLTALLTVFIQAQTATCPSERGAYILENGAWVPMRGVYASKIIPGHMKTMGGAGLIAIFADGESARRVDSSNPIFCVVGAESETAVQLLSLQARGKERRVIVAQTANWKGSYAVHQRWFQPEAVIPVDVTKVHEKAYEFSPKLDLSRGEYILFTDLPDGFPRGKTFDPHLVKGYDFGYFAR